MKSIASWLANLFIVNTDWVGNKHWMLISTNHFCKQIYFIRQFYIYKQFNFYKQFYFFKQVYCYFNWFHKLDHVFLSTIFPSISKISTNSLLYTDQFTLNKNSILEHMNYLTEKECFVFSNYKNVPCKLL